MILNKHSDLYNKHSLFSPSQPSFFNYTAEEFFDRFINKYRPALGTDIHEWAAIKIKRCHKVPASIRDMLKDIDEYIFNKYYDQCNDTIDGNGKRILACLKYVCRHSPEVFEGLRNYVNDAISYKMMAEVTLWYTDEFYGHADALIFNDNLLRIHDLKTGSTQAHIEQLYGYAALFCLEYSIDPMSISYELAIYQGTDIFVANPSGEEIMPFIAQYKAFNNIIAAFEGGKL